MILLRLLCTDPAYRKHVFTDSDRRLRDGLRYTVMDDLVGDSDGQYKTDSNA